MVAQDNPISNCHILWPDFEAFILILPDDCGNMNCISPFFV